MKKAILLFEFLLFSLLVSQINFVSAADTIDLTEEEEQFIIDNPKIFVGIDNQFAPYEFIDNDEHYKGICADYLSLISNKTGLNFIFPYPNLEWATVYQKAVDKEVDALACVGITPQRESIFDFSNPYIYFERVILSNEDDPNKYKISDLNSLRVGVQNNSSHYSYLLSETDAVPIVYTNLEDALISLSEKNIDVVVGNLATTGYLLKEMNITNVEIDTIIASKENTLAFAVQKDMPILLSIINKGLASITTEEKLEINDKWIGLEQDSNIERIIRITAIIGGVLLIVIIISQIWAYYLRKINKELDIARKEADEANRVKSQFVANMSHEIRTPMNAIVGLLGLLDDDNLNTIQKNYILRTKKSAKNLVTIINDILDFSKIESEQLVIENVQFDLEEVLDDIITSVSLQAFNKDVKLVSSNKWDFSHLVYGDPLRIGQVIINLLSNAIKFTEEGIVNISVDPVEQSDKEIIIDFIVRDKGIGMTTNQINRLFVPFTQGDPTITRKYGGTGLGLSISKSLVEAMGGEIFVQSTLNEGSTFSFRLPFALGSQRNKITDEFKDFLKTIRVLIVDKYHESRDSIASYLQSFDIYSHGVESGSKAIDVINEYFNLVIIDNQLDDGNGIEISKGIQKKLGEKTPHMILLTSYESSSELSDVFRFGINGALEKPINRYRLYNSILEVFDKIPDSKLEKSTNLKIQNRFEDVKVLLVEDNEENQIIMREILNKTGMEVTISNNGKEAVDYFNGGNTCDIVLMDLHMPVMNGYDASLEIRRLGYLDIPIIALTADVLDGVKENVTLAKMNDYIQKPIDIDVVLSKISQYVTVKEVVLEIKDDTEKIRKTLTRFNVDKALKRMMNNVDIYIDLLHKYQKKSLDTINKFIEFDKAGSQDEAYRCIHTVTGVSGNLGAEMTYYISLDLEKDYKKNGTIDRFIFDKWKKNINDDSLQISKLSNKIGFIKLTEDSLLSELFDLKKQIEDYEILQDGSLNDIFETLKSRDVKLVDTLETSIQNRNYEKSLEVLIMILQELEEL